MELNSIINNTDISMRLQDVYSYIDKNNDKFEDIFEKVYEDLQKNYSDVVKNNDTIKINNISKETIISDRVNCQNILTYHSRHILDDYSYIVSYAFKMELMADGIKIIKKR